jgi:ATP-dependent Clp protease ATP-binding subunit ClpC
LPALADLFEIVAVPKLDRRQAVAALGEVAAAHRRNLHLEMEGGVVETVYRLFARFMPYQGFPGRATGFVSELFDRALRHKRPRVGLGDVIEQFVRQTGLPEKFLRDEVPLAREAVLDELRKQVVGQEAACRAAADLVLTFKAGLNDPNRPPGVLLFVGPTGVGKTEMAKALSRFFFGHGEKQDRLLRLDMSEYAGPGAAERLLGGDFGGPSGLTGLRGEPSPLIRRVRQQPFSVLLLDEIEKAAPEVFDLLLGVFDEGRLTDPYGRLTTFRSTILIMTSNLGADRPAGFGLGKRSEPAPPGYDDAAMSFFRPEFFNRIDAVVTFEPLGRETVRSITEKELREIAGREGLARAGLRLRWTGRAAAELADRGFDRRYGARPLLRVLETLVVAPLAKFLIDRPDLRDAEVLLDVGEGGAMLFRSA